MKRLILLLLCATLCHATSVTIAESTYADASGRLATGTVTISWPSFSNGTSNIAAGSTTVVVTAGVLSVSLVANDTADPPFNYTASFRLQTASYSEQWKVPTLAGPLTIQQVKWSSNSPVTVGLDQLRRTGHVAGDIAYYDGILWKRLARGTNGQVLTIDTSLSGYLKWATGGGGGGTWGGIGGTLSDQTDLSTALALKLAKASNLSDLSSASTARTNLGLGTAAVAASSDFEVPLTFVSGRLTRTVNSVDLTGGIVTPASCGDTTHSCSVTVDTYGRVTAATNNTISSGGSGTVTVVSSGALTSTALVTGGGSATVQTPSATATLDASGNFSTPGTLSGGVGSTVGATAALGNSTGDTGASSWTINSGDGASNTEPGYLKIKSSHTTKRSAYLFPCTDADGFYCIASSTPVADSTDIIVTKANTVTFTGKTYDTAGSGNSFSINGLAATANTGTGAVVRATALSPLKIKTCTVALGQQGASAPVLSDDNDVTLGACKNYTGVDWTVLTVGCQADAASLVIQPRLHGGSSASILTGDLTCGNTVDTFGTVQGTAPVVHSYSGAGSSATCSVTPCSADVLITTAGGSAKSAIVTLVVSLP